MEYQYTELDIDEEYVFVISRGSYRYQVTMRDTDDGFTALSAESGRL